MSFFEKTQEERLELGIKGNLVRFAIGVEDADDLISDLDRALNVLARS
jgi:cystathionine beta-lyase/cystathionine gamma-synthase